MGTAYTRKLKPGHANNPENIIRIIGEVKRVLSGIVGLGVDSEEFASEVLTQMQPDPEGGLAIIGWIGRDPQEGIPEHNYDEEVEFVPPVLAAEEQRQMEQEMQEAISARQPPPFPIAQ